MQLEEVKSKLIEIQNSTFESKLLNLIFDFYQQQDAIKNALTELQDKLNATIIEVNALLAEKEEKVKEKE